MARRNQQGAVRVLRTRRVKLIRIVALPAQAPGIESGRSIVRNRFPFNVDRHNIVGFMGDRSG